MEDLSPQLQAWLQAFVRERQQPEEVIAWANAISARVFAEVPELGDDPVLQQRVTAAVREHWTAFLGHETGPVQPFSLVPAAGEISADLARRGLPLPVLLHIYRAGQRAVWDSIATLIISGDPPATRAGDSAQALRYIWSRATEWLDAAVEASIEVFQREQDRTRQSRNAQVLEAVRDVLEGARPDPRMLSAMLNGHPLSGLQTALLLHAHDPDAVGDLREVATRVMGDLGGRNNLVVSPGGRDLWCWVATRAEPAHDALDGASSWLKARRITVAVGGSSAGVPGFAQSHAEAREAQRILFSTRQDGQVLHYRDVELLALMSARPEAARRFAERVLGPLSADDETVARLRETVEAVLGGGGVDAAAKALIVHRNTIRYRMKQAEELLGRAVSSDATEIAAALRYHRAFLSKH